MITLPAVEPNKTGTDDDLTHLYCCDITVGLCGTALEGPEVDDDDNICVVCDDLDQFACESCGWAP